MAHKYERIKPSNPKTKPLNTKNWNGLVYAHRDVVNNNRDKPLSGDEVVHHLDCNKFRNSIGNLIVLSNSDHVKLHHWIKNGCPVYIPEGEDKGKYMTHHGVKEESEVYKSYRKCARSNCNNTVGYNSKYCSKDCYLAENSSARPSKEEIITELNSDMSIEDLGRKYNITGNGYKKWCRHYGLSPLKKDRRSS